MILFSLFSKSCIHFILSVTVSFIPCIEPFLLIYIVVTFLPRITEAFF